MSDYNNLFSPFDPFQDSLQQQYLNFNETSPIKPQQSLDCLYSSRCQQQVKDEGQEIKRQREQYANNSLTLNSFQQNINIPSDKNSVVKLSPEEHTKLLERNCCLRTTSLQDIEPYLRQNLQKLSHDLTPETYRLTIKAVVRRKMILKRQRAKNRIQRSCNVDQMMIPQLQQDMQGQTINNLIPNKTNTRIKEGQGINEDKRKRNRISAQNSRDRRRTYLTDLQIKNQILKQEFNQVQQQNYKLKQELEQYQKQQSQHSNFQSLQNQKDFKGNKKHQGNNKFMKILVFLGILFMISVMKDFFGGNSSKFMSKSKGKHALNLQNSQCPMPIDDQQEKQILYKSEVIQIVKETSQMLSEQLSHIGKVRTVELPAVRKLQEKLQKTKNQHNHNFNREEQPEMDYQQFQDNLFIHSSITDSNNISIQGTKIFEYLMKQIPSPKEVIKLPIKVVQCLRQAQAMF